jgi:hypothetical protein
MLRAPQEDVDCEQQAPQTPPCRSVHFEQHESSLLDVRINPGNVKIADTDMDKEPIRSLPRAASETLGKSPGLSLPDHTAGPGGGPLPQTAPPLPGNGLRADKDDALSCIDPGAAGASLVCGGGAEIGGDGRPHVGGDVAGWPAEEVNFETADEILPVTSRGPTPAGSGGV